MMHPEVPPIKSLSHHNDELSLTPIHKPSYDYTCLESYQLFKNCSSQSRGTEGLNCTDVVSAYMKCALKGTCRW